MVGAAPRSVRASFAWRAANCDAVRLPDKLIISVDAVSIASHACVIERWLIRISCDPAA